MREDATTPTTTDRLAEVLLYTQARKLLAVEYECEGAKHLAGILRDTLKPVSYAIETPLRAIVAALADLDKAQQRLAMVEAENARLREAAQSVIDGKMSTYTARNGRRVGIQADDGEMCWIIHSDHIFALETALNQPGKESGK